MKPWRAEGTEEDIFNAIACIKAILTGKNQWTNEFNQNKPLQFIIIKMKYQLQFTTLY